MTQRENQISEKDPQERITVSFDFTADLGADTIQAPVVVTVAQKRGAVIDPGVGAMIYAAAAVSGKKVLVGIANGLTGNDYLIRCKVDTVGNHTYVRACVLPVRNAD